MKEIIDIGSLPEIERDIYLQDSWCDKCGQADLGIVNPELYIESGQKHISGSCKVCSEQCISTITEKQVKL